MFEVLHSDALLAEGSRGTDYASSDIALLLTNGLNQREQEGWTLFKVIDQHRQWGHEGDSQEMGGLYGPYYVFYRAMKDGDQPALSIFS